MGQVILVSRRRGQKQRCYPVARAVAVLPDRLVNADSGEVIAVRVDGRWYRQSEIQGSGVGAAVDWEFPMIVDGVEG